MFLLELAHLMFMYVILLLPALTTSRQWLWWWAVVVIGMNLSWVVNQDKCILTQVETHFGKKHPRDTLGCRYTILTQREKKVVSRCLLLLVALTY